MIKPIVVDDERIALESIAWEGRAIRVNSGR